MSVSNVFLLQKIAIVCIKIRTIPESNLVKLDYICVCVCIFTYLFLLAYESLMICGLSENLFYFNRLKYATAN